MISHRSVFLCRTASFFNKRLTSVSAARKPCLLDFDEVPKPKGVPILGTLLSLVAAGGAPKLHTYIDKRHKQLGSIFKESIGPITSIFISDPREMRNVFAREGKYPKHVLPEAWLVYNKKYGCKRGLFFMDNEEWLRFRKILNRLMLKCDQNRIEDACKAVNQNIVKNLKIHSEKNEIVTDLEGKLYNWSVHVLISNIIGPMEYSKQLPRIKSQIDLLANKVHMVFATTSKLQLVPATLAEKFNLSVWKNFKSSVDNALNIAKGLVENLLDHCDTTEGLLGNLKTEGIDREDIVRVVTDLVLAAGDTTAYTMEWILYCLANNCRIQEGYRREITDRQTYLRNIVKETLRLYPVAPFLTRYLPDDAVFCGYNIPANTLICYSIYTACRNEKIFTNPDKFHPERWNRSEEAETEKRVAMQLATIPFAIGARSCIGRKIAETQLQTLTDEILKNFQVTMADHKDLDPVLKMVMVPAEPLKIKLISL